jgi:5-methylcytosine-specific restriction endonuclease McrA
MKLCKKGHPFERHKNGKGQTRCAECNRIMARENYKKSPEKTKKWQKKNKEKLKLYRERWYSKLTPNDHEEIRKRLREYYYKNREKYIFNNVLRKALKIKATPKWADETLMRDIYLEAKYHGLVVDHIIPLKGKTVCGLHWEGNLQLLSDKDNRSKGNRLLFN